MISYEAVDASGTRISRSGISREEWATHRSNLVVAGYRFGYVFGLDDEPTDLPLLHLAAESEDGTTVLSWFNGRWSGTPWARAIADFRTQAGDELHLISGFRPVTPDDGHFIYACAVLTEVIGPGATWVHQLPPAYQAALTGADEDGDAEMVIH